MHDHPVPGVALYGRVSGAEDQKKRLTIEIQQSALRAWADAEGLPVVGEYWDTISGKKPLDQRPQGARLVADCRAGRVGVVAVYVIDRFGRTLLDGLQAAKQLEDLGVAIIAISEGIDTRRDDDPLNLQIRLMMAESDHRRTVKRLSDGKQRAMARDNAPPGGPLTFGYRMAENGWYVIDPVEGPVVQEMFERAAPPPLGRGQSNAEILAWVRTTGVRPGRKFQKRGSTTATVVAGHEDAEWHLTKIGKILSNPVYIGVRTWGGREFPSPPLVSQELFDAVQERNRARRELMATKGSPASGLLSGLLVCGSCGARFYHKQNRVRRKDGHVDAYDVYICDSVRRPPKGHRCNAKLLRQAELDAEVWAVCESILRDPAGLIRKLSAADEQAVNEIDQLDLEEGRLVAELDEIDREVQGIWAEAEANDWPLQFVTPRVNRLRDRRVATEGRLLAIRGQRASLDAARAETHDMTVALQRIRTALDAGLTEEQKWQYVRRLVRGVTVHTVGTGRQKTARLDVRLAWHPNPEEMHTEEFPTSDTTELSGTPDERLFHYVMTLRHPFNHRYR